jgi:phosphoserine phosphatase
VRALAATHDYDLRTSFAYSDSINDLPLLVSVGNPFIVNPNKHLENVALKNRWPILTH